jgi:hypothetical protein
MTFLNKQIFLILYYRSNKRQVKYLLWSKITFVQIELALKWIFYRFFFFTSLTENNFLIVTSTKTCVGDDSDIRSEVQPEASSKKPSVRTN